MFRSELAPYFRHALDLVGQGCGAALPNLRAAEAIHGALLGQDRALEGYSATIQREIGREMIWAKRLAAIFFRLPSVSYRLGVKHPGSPERMAQLLCGELRYSDSGQRAISRLSGGVF